ncbi:MAG: FKBP-type peptidyl-prolyl cis-trans isomerase [Gammaproteobacteria bacterium]
MNIDNNCVVTLHYKLTDDTGGEIDTSPEHEPMIYLHGGGELIDGLENALTGKAAGDSFDVTIPPEEAYGDEDPELIREFEVEFFNGVEMRPGMELQGKDPEGNFRLLRVVEVNDDKVKVNMNHPLAGLTLVFAVNIIDVRVATPDEIEQGHVQND